MCKLHGEKNRSNIRYQIGLDGPTRMSVRVYFLSKYEFTTLCSYVIGGYSIIIRPTPGYIDKRLTESCFKMERCRALPMRSNTWSVRGSRRAIDRKEGFV